MTIFAFFRNIIFLFQNTQLFAKVTFPVNFNRVLFKWLAISAMFNIISNGNIFNGKFLIQNEFFQLRCHNFKPSNVKYC